MTCNYQTHARYQKRKDKVPGTRVTGIKRKYNSLKAVSNTSKIKDMDIADDLCKWSKLKNSKFRSCSVSTEHVPQVKLSNRFTVLKINKQITGLLKHMENKVKQIAGMTKFRKRRFYYLKIVMGRKLDPCS
jgi:hypothetical protein